MRRRSSSTIVLISSLVSLWKTIDVVDAVEELGPEDLLQLAHDPVLHVVVRDAGLVVGHGEAERRVARDLRRPDVRGHDHDAWRKSTVRPCASVSRRPPRI
jgi:hypothetical protein